MAVMLLEWVFTSLFLILVVLALRAALGKRMSAGARYALWAVVLVRLLVPVQLFTSPLAGTHVFSESRVEKIDTDVYKYSGPGAEKDALKDLGGQDGPSGTLTTFPDAPSAPKVPDAPEPPSPPDLTKAPAWLGWTWLAGSAAVAVVFLLSNLRFFWRLRRERIPLDEADLPLRVYVAVGLPSPCLFGILRPAIYVTPEAAANPDMLRHVLAHEYTHFRHGDHIWSLLRCAALAVHWWNPLVWLAAVLSQRDGELACDEGALKRLGDGERAAYGSTLLALVTAKPRPGDLFRCATTMAGDKKSLKERITRIAAAPKRVLWAVVVAVMVTALACLCAFGQAEPETDGDPDLSSEPSPAPTAMQVVPANGTEAITMEVQRDAGEFVRERYESLRDDGVMYGLDGAAGIISDPPKVDGWRIESLTGPYWSGELCWDALGVDRRVELWNVVYAFHTTTPDKALNLANGGTGLTEDGWLTPLNYGADYLVYEIGEDGSRTLLTDFGDTDAVSSVQFRRHLRTKLAAGGIPENLADAYYVEEHAEQPLFDLGLDLGDGVDLNGNGIPELVQLVTADGGGHQRLELWEGNQLLWTGEGFSAHAGWVGYFLCTLDGKDFLLRYTPTMYGGVCNYTYTLFQLEQNGGERVVEENSIEFETNFATPLYTGNFDPYVIGGFMETVNGLLAHSVQLMNTDPDLAETFQREGRLYDSLGWLDWDWPGEFTRDPAKTLTENLLVFQKAMETETCADTPTLFPVDELGKDIRLNYRDKSVRFESPGWEYGFQLPPGWVSGSQSAEYVNLEILDLNGDGKQEIVFILIEGHGTGCLIESLYVFDADTLEQYDTRGLTEMILDSIVSAGDEDNFYLSGLGLDETIPKAGAAERNEHAPMADALWMGEYIQYSIEDGRIWCGLGCEASGVLLNYIGSVNVPVRLTPAGTFACGTAQYVPFDL